MTMYIKTWRAQPDSGQPQDEGRQQPACHQLLTMYNHSNLTCANTAPHTYIDLYIIFIFHMYTNILAFTRANTHNQTYIWDKSQMQYSIGEDLWGEKRSEELLNKLQYSHMDNCKIKCFEPLLKTSNQITFISYKLTQYQTKIEI